LAYCQARKDWLPDKEWANVHRNWWKLWRLAGLEGKGEVGSDLRWSNEEALLNSDVLGYSRMELQGKPLEIFFTNF